MDWIKTILAGVVGAAATIFVGLFGYWNTDRSHDIEMVRISLSILAGENEDTSLNGRRFALRALEKYSEVDIPESEFEQWAAAGTIPEIPLSIWSMESQIGDSYAGWVALDRAVADKVEAISQMEALQQALVERGLSAAEAEQFAREFFGVPKPTPAGDPDPAEASSAQGPD